MRTLLLLCFVVVSVSSAVAGEKKIVSPERSSATNWRCRTLISAAQGFSVDGTLVRLGTKPALISQPGRDRTNLEAELKTCSR